MSLRLISNPGSIPELMKFAEWSLANNKRTIYAAPLAVNSSTVSKVESLRSAPLRKIASRLRSRAVPLLNEAEHTWRCGTTAELKFLRARAGSPTGALKDLKIRNEEFDRRVARRVEKHGGVDVAIARSTAALMTLREVKRTGVGILDYPIVHHELLAELIRDESREFPHLSHTMTVDMRTASERVALDREIEEADKILTLSEPHRESFRRAGVPAHKLFQIPLGVDVSLFSPPTVFNANPRHIVFSGQVIQRKGIGYLFKLMDTLPAQYKLTIAGSAPDPSVIPRTERIEYLGPLPRAELANLYRTAGVYVFPSLAEGFPQTPLEALACGVPAIVSDAVYGNNGPVTHGENGFLVNPRDVEKMKDLVMSVCEDESMRSRLSGNAASTARGYTWERFGSALDGEIEQWLPNPGI